MWDGLFIPLQPKTTHTHSDVHTNPSSRKVVFPATTGPQHPDTPRLGDVPTGCPDLGRRPAAGGSALPHKLRGRGKGRGYSGGFAFCLQPGLLRSTVRPRGWGRSCEHHVVDDPVVPARGGEEGVIEWGPRDVPHEVSVGSASEPRTEEFEHGRGRRENRLGEGTRHTHTRAMGVALPAGEQRSHSPKGFGHPHFPEVATPARAGVRAAQIRRHIEAREQVHFRYSVGCLSPATGCIPRGFPM